MTEDAHAEQASEGANSGEKNHVVAVIPAEGWQERDSAGFRFPLIAWVFYEDGTVDAISCDGDRPSAVNFVHDVVEPIGGWGFGA